MSATYDPNWNQASYPETERLDTNAALIPDEWGGYGRPVPPLSRIIRERDYGTKCPKCGSSLKRRWLFIKTDRCIQPECENYFYGLPMFDTSVPMPPVEAPKLTLKDAYAPPTGIKITNWREAR